MDDKQLILYLGGPSKLCARLGYDKATGGVQRVANWMTRGIPSKVKVDHPDLFLRPAGDLPSAIEQAPDVTS
jgi:hypothetical protein